jgi:hypothetical protein
MDLLWTHTKLWCCCYVIQRRKPVDFPFLLSQTKYQWSLALVVVDVDSATHDIADQCGAGGQPKLDLLSTHTKLWCCCNVRRWREPVDFPLLLSQTKYQWSLAPVVVDVDSATHDIADQCGADGRYTAQIGPSQKKKVVEVSCVGVTMA